MLSKNVSFLQILFFQSILFFKTDEYELQIVSSTEIPSKSYKESHQVDLILEVVNEMKSQLEEMRKEILTLKEHNIQTQLQEEKKLTILKNEFAEYKNWFENNIQIQWQKFEQKQKDQQSLQNNFTKTYLENSHDNLQKLIESMLQNQTKQHNNIVNEVKSQFETTRKKILTLKENNNQFDVYKKSLEIKIDVLISHSNDTKTNIKNVDNELAESTPPKSCIDVQKNGKTLSGIHTIWPDFSPKSFDVWCDMKTRNGGWIYVMNRFDGSVDFNLNWTDYKNGFGDLNGEFWLGLEHLYILTKNKPNELLIELVHQNFRKAYAHYQEFSIGDEGERYPIKTMKDYSGDAGNYFISHLGRKFSTADRDHDNAEGNCAKAFGGGFWYNNCHACLLTGIYHIYNETGIQCSSFRIKHVKMMIKY